MSRAPVPPTASDAALDGLRGLAALIVVASHASQQGLFLVPGLDLAGIGKSGVYLFFVISAYLLTQQWLEVLAPGRPLQGPLGTKLLRYLVRRVARIFPLYSLVLVLAWWLHPRSLGVPIDGTELWRHLALLEGKDLYWSVPVEFKYYLLIPGVAWLLARSGPLGLKAAVLAFLIAVLGWVYPPGVAPSNSIQLGYYLPVFLCGSLAAAWVARRLLQPLPEGPVEPTRAARHLWDLCALAMLIASIPAVARLAWPAVEADFLHRTYLAWGVFWSAVLAAMVAGRLPAWQRVCNSAALRACGRWCFGLYLLHLPALIVARKLPLGETLQAWAGLGLSVLVAAAAHRLVERPAMQWVQRFGAPSLR